HHGPTHPGRYGTRALPQHSVADGNARSRPRRGDSRSRRTHRGGRRRDRVPRKGKRSRRSNGSLTVSTGWTPLTFHRKLTGASFTPSAGSVFLSKLYGMGTGIVQALG